jgi:outer membrane protein
MKRMDLKALTGVFLILFSLTAPVRLLADEYSLEDLFRIALTRSEKLKAAEETLVISEIGKDKAYSYLLPRVTATAGYTQYTEKKYYGTSVIQPNYGSSWGIRIDETFSLSGRELTGLEIAKANVTKSTHDLTAVREDYLLRYVAVAYYSALMARKGLEIADANLERLTTYRNAAEARLKIGEVTRTVLLRAEGELSGAKSDSLQAKNSLELALAVLANNCGIRDPLTLSESASEERVLSPLNVFQEQAYSARADLRSLEVQKQIAADQTKFAEGAYWPNLSIFGGYTGADQSPPPTSLNRESLYAGAALNFPFFEGGLRKAEVREAKARERQAALYYEDLKKTIEIEVRTAYLDLVTQKGILRFLNDQMVFARDNYRAVARQFEFGLSSSLDVLDANTLLVSAERRVASALYNYRLALLRMKKATGTLLGNEAWSK